MPEVPERKVLRDMLLKMKEKIFHSRDRSLESVKRATEFLSKISEARSKTKGTDDPALKTLDQWLSSTELVVSSLLDTTLTLIEDAGMYIDLLEHLAVEYDKTLVAYLKKVRKEVETKEPPKTIFA